jgi:hypothetical protein
MLIPALWIQFNITIKPYSEDMGEPIVKASGRTFNGMSTYVPAPSKVHHEEPFSISLTYHRSPSEALESGFPMVANVTTKFI